MVWNRHGRGAILIGTLHNDVAATLPNFDEPLLSQDRT
jgi:hypothetical protein